jgi:hypothetical protein
MRTLAWHRTQVKSPSFLITCGSPAIYASGINGAVLHNPADDTSFSSQRNADAQTTDGEQFGHSFVFNELDQLGHSDFFGCKYHPRNEPPMGGSSSAPA